MSGHLTFSIFFFISSFVFLSFWVCVGVGIQFHRRYSGSDIITPCTYSIIPGVRSMDSQERG